MGRADGRPKLRFDRCVPSSRQRHGRRRPDEVCEGTCSILASTPILKRTASPQFSFGTNWKSRQFLGRFARVADRWGHSAFSKVAGGRLSCQPAFHKEVATPQGRLSGRDYRQEVQMIQFVKAIPCRCRRASSCTRATRADKAPPHGS